MNNDCESCISWSNISVTSVYYNIYDIEIQKIASQSRCISFIYSDWIVFPSKLFPSDVVEGITDEVKEQLNHLKHANKGKPKVEGEYTTNGRHQSAFLKHRNFIFYANYYQITYSVIVVLLLWFCFSIRDLKYTLTWTRSDCFP